MIQRGFVQAAYHVRDIELAARRFASELGAGPFHLIEHIALEDVVYRGRPASLDHSSAYGQAGPIMIELVQQHGEHPSVFRELFGPDEEGLHHMACFAPDLDAELARLAGLGHPTAFRARTATGVGFAFVDTAPVLGHMLEVYEEHPQLRAFYAAVARAAEGWDGERPIRR